MKYKSTCNSGILSTSWCGPETSLNPNLTHFAVWPVTSQSSNPSVNSIGWQICSTSKLNKGKIFQESTIIKLFALQTWIRKLLTTCVKETFYFCLGLSGEMVLFPLAGDGGLNIAKLPIKKKTNKTITPCSS